MSTKNETSWDANDLHWMNAIRQVEIRRGDKSFFLVIVDVSARMPQTESGPTMTLGELQQRILDLYGEKDGRRGVDGTFMWFMEEVGELSAALRGGTHDERILEFADVLAWLATLANCVGVDLEEAMRRKYGGGCPGCGRTPCECTTEYKP